MLQFLLSSSSSYRSSCTMSSAKSHLTTTVQLLMVHFIFPECPGLAALLSLASVVTKQRQSVFTIQRLILSPALPTLQQVLFNFVILASTVLEHFQLQPLVKISLFILNLSLHRTCQEAITSEQCVLNRSVSSSHDILVEFTRPDFTMATVSFVNNPNITSKGVGNVKCVRINFPSVNPWCLVCSGKFMITNQ